MMTARNETQDFVTALIEQRRRDLGEDGEPGYGGQGTRFLL